MSAEKSLGLITRAGATAARASGLGAAASPSALAAAPLVTVSPASGPADGRTVTLSATGLTARNRPPRGAVCLRRAGRVRMRRRHRPGSHRRRPRGAVGTRLAVNSALRAVAGSATEPWGSVNRKVTRALRPRRRWRAETRGRFAGLRPGGFRPAATALRPRPRPGPETRCGAVPFRPAGQAARARCSVSLSKLLFRPATASGLRNMAETLV